MKITSDSHLDHALTPEQIQYIVDTFSVRQGFFAETIDLPESLGTVPCGLYGPLAGDPPIEDDATYLAMRPPRGYVSRLVDREMRPSTKLTVIAGPSLTGDETVLYTAFGGPYAPREPGDPSLTDPAEIAASRAFWAEHALVSPPPRIGGMLISLRHSAQVFEALSAELQGAPTRAALRRVLRATEEQVINLRRYVSEIDQAVERSARTSTR